MSEFQVVVVGPRGTADNEAPHGDDLGAAAGAGGAAGGAPARPDLRAHSVAGDRVVAGIEELQDVWDTVIGKLTGLAAQSRAAAEDSPFELSTIEFNLGIEAGLSIGFVTRGEASVMVAFTRKPEPGAS
ncbi:hypothetical protein [Cellulomonas sp. ATA003]|uniref:hypothetical protein n=1 Tax=Cellulomonas sp. ATA003 TaxID=3073064 RepID=UPI0028733BCC|nr:hypothetical protein [Cellulomonas sp. ATA003]WNB86615.1 hypothetical protein REH70_05120 [Cellulomonas sp. ATA003]